MNRLWLRISFSFIVLMFFTILGVGLYLTFSMKSTYTDIIRKQLTEHANLVAKAVDTNNLQNKSLLKKNVDDFSAEIDSRITIIDVDGNVLADSEKEEKLENHRERPEFKAVIDQQQPIGESVRYSETLQMQMMYVAVPIFHNDSLIGAIRASLSLGEIEHSLRKLWISAASALAVALLLAGIISMRIAKGITHPIEEIIFVSDKLAKKDYDARVKVKTKGELKKLSDAINILATSLQKQMIEIEENEQRLTGVLTNMVSGVMLVNKEGRINLVNPAIENFIGAPSGSLIGKLHVEATRSFGLSKLINQCLKLEKKLHDEVHIYYPKERILDAHLAPYKVEKGEVKGIVIVLHDITNIRRLEKMRTEFVANVSHELKTPVTAVKGFAETLLAGELEDSQTTQYFLNIIYEESDRLHRLISDLLHLTKIEHQLVPLQLEDVNVVAEVNKTVKTLQESANSKNIKLILPEKESAVIEAEKDRVQQIILNLLTNAINYTPENGEVKIAVLEKDNAVDLIIKDTGIGVPKKELPRIFERFYRVDKARSRSSGGTGLGLAIVKHLVEAHNGKINVKSIEGEGTTFTVTFPKKQNKPIH